MGKRLLRRGLTGLAAFMFLWLYVCAGLGYAEPQDAGAYQVDAAFEAYLVQQGFPESYKPGLRQIHAAYPSWVFQAFQTGLDWNAVIDAEMEGTGSLVENTSISSWKSVDSGKYNWETGTWPGFDGAKWVAASREIVSYYMDPRNFLDERSIFQFLSHGYDPSIQNIEGVRRMLEGSFMAKASSDTASTEASSDTASVANGAVGPGGAVSQGASYESPVGTLPLEKIEISSEGPIGTSASAQEGNAAGTEGGSSAAVSLAGDNASAEGSGTGNGTDYAAIIMRAAEQTGLNPYVLTSMILQEQGIAGKSGSISGASGYYNYLNVGAYASGGMSAVERGIWYASQTGTYGRPWDSIEKAIVGGASFYVTNYVNAGQNTLYLKKWNVQGSDMFKHQYMTNVPGAQEEGLKLGNAYTGEVRAAGHVFSIPVYQNMPAEPCPMPTADGETDARLHPSGSNVEAQASEEGTAASNEGSSELAAVISAEGPA